MKAGYFADFYESGKEFCWNGPYSQDCFSNFLKLLANSVNIDEISNTGMISLLEEWDCPELVDCLIRKAKSDLDHTIMHNGYQYSVNLRKISALSQLFCEQIENSADSVVSVNDEYPEETFSHFLDCLNGLRSLPRDEKLVDIYQLCMDWKCDEFLKLINPQSTNYILSSLTKGGVIEPEILEGKAAQYIHTLVKEPRFYNLPLSSLGRIVPKSSLFEQTESIQRFI